MDNSPPEVLRSRDRRPGALGELRILPDELICSILESLDPRDVARCACVSSVMYVLCNEEPLWMSLCFKRINGPLQYKGSWKKTALHLENQEDEYEKPPRMPLYFDGFNSSFMYRRFYRCHTALDGFYLDRGDIERRANLSLEDFHNTYDGKKPVLLTGLVDTWPARNTWSVDNFLLKHGDKAFRISQRSSRKISMRFEDYVSYIKLQQDEDPLYIFDDKFGEVAPDLLKDYNVPYLFQEDYFDVLDRDQRPPFRWLIVGPQRSGASWHVDPALTSAWNTLLCGRKRWALYPPGRVPSGVTVHVNDEDGDVDIETPSSLQWWLDFYPLLADEDKPIECTQLPGETIYVPSGWWHCILNLDTTIAVTQNFVNSNNLEFVCLDMAPGHRHKGVCRAGFLALDERSLETAENSIASGSDSLSDFDFTRKEKRMRTLETKDIQNYEKESNGLSKYHQLWKQGISYDIAFLSTFLDEERDHYNSPWSSGNCIGQRELRQWFSKLWIQKPEMRELVWKGACLALNVGKWLECVVEICAFYNLSPPTEDERLPVGTGSNPVYLMDDRVIKIFVEGGLEASVYSLGTELEFYSLLHKVNSLLKDHIPNILASGIVYIDDGTYKVVPWDGKDVPDGIAKCHLTFDICKDDEFPLGIWSKKKFEYKKAGLSINESSKSAYTAKIWPFIITKRCSGKIFAQLREMLSKEDILNLASFLGEKLRYLHLLPHQDFVDPTFADVNHKIPLSSTEYSLEAISDGSNISSRWDIFVGILRLKRKDVINRLKKWGDFIPNKVLQKVEEYIPDDLGTLLEVFEAENGLNKIWDGYSWIHSDIMDDNILMEPCLFECCPDSNVEGFEDDDSMNGYNGGGKRKSWRPSYIIDFSDLSIGDPLCDLIPIYLDIFRGDATLLKKFLESYKLPLVRRSPQAQHDPEANKFRRLSYRAMCYCILHDENIMGAILSIWEELKTADSWEEIELTVWGELNNYKGIAQD